MLVTTILVGGSPRTAKRENYKNYCFSNTELAEQFEITNLPMIYEKQRHCAKYWCTSDLPKQSPKMKVRSSSVLHSLHTGPTKAAIHTELHACIWLLR